MQIFRGIGAFAQPSHDHRERKVAISGLRASHCLQEKGRLFCLYVDTVTGPTETPIINLLRGRVFPPPLSYTNMQQRDCRSEGINDTFITYYERKHINVRSKTKYLNDMSILQ